jgi:hypothetical protein
LRANDTILSNKAALAILINTFYYSSAISTLNSSIRAMPQHDQASPLEFPRSCFRKSMTKAFGTRLRLARRTCGDPERGGYLSQERFAELVSLRGTREGFPTPGTVSNWECGRVFRQTMDAIHERLPAATGIHVFFAGPASLAFYCGQLVSKTIHPRFVVYNYTAQDVPRYSWGFDLTRDINAPDFLVQPACGRDVKNDPA